MKTKIICLLIALVGVLAMFASCGDGGDQPYIEPGTPPPPEEGFYYYWDNTELIFELTENNNVNELSSTLKRYLAGEEDEALGLNNPH